MMAPPRIHPRDPHFTCEQCGKVNIFRSRNLKHRIDENGKRYVKTQRFCDGVCRNLARIDRMKQGFIDKNGYRVLSSYGRGVMVPANE